MSNDLSFPCISITFSSFFYFLLKSRILSCKVALLLQVVLVNKRTVYSECIKMHLFFPRLRGRKEKLCRFVQVFVSSTWAGKRKQSKECYEKKRVKENQWIEDDQSIGSERYVIGTILLGPSNFSTVVKCTFLSDLYHERNNSMKPGEWKEGERDVVWIHIHLIEGTNC